MHTRRATITSYWPTGLDGHIEQFGVGDIVVSTLVPNTNFYGIVKDVDKRINKVSVAWGGGSLCQHDPEEVQLSLRTLSDDKGERLASRRTAGSQFVGDPKEHGIDSPIDGGTNIMQEVVEKQKKEILEESKSNPKTADLKSRRAMYWCGPDRTYRITKSEKISGDIRCPKCCASMDSHRFTRKAKLFMCDDCGFKISSDKVLRDRPDYGENLDEDIVVAKSRRATINNNYL